MTSPISHDWSAESRSVGDTHRGRWVWARPTCPVWCSGWCFCPPAWSRRGSCSGAPSPPPAAPAAWLPRGRSPGTTTPADTAALWRQRWHRTLVEVVGVEGCVRRGRCRCFPLQINAERRFLMNNLEAWDFLLVVPFASQYKTTSSYDHQRSLAGLHALHVGQAMRF